MSDSDYQKEAKESHFVIYIAAAFGAFCLGLGDLINNGTNSTIVKISEVLRVHMHANFDHAAYSLMLLILLGIGICAVKQPRTRMDSFMVGFSVFAVLTVVTPAQEPQVEGSAMITPSAFEPEDDEAAFETSSLFSNLLGISAAYAQDTRVTPTTDETNTPSDSTDKPPEPTAANQATNTENAEVATETGQERPIEIHVAYPQKDGDDKPKEATITVRDKSTNKVVTRTHIDTSQAVQIPTQLQGAFVLEIEGSGLRRSRAEIDTRKPDVASSYELEVRRSIVPKNLQHLYAPKEAELKPMDAASSE